MTALFFFVIWIEWNGLWIELDSIVLCIAVEWNRVKSSHFATFRKKSWKSICLPIFPTAFRSVCTWCNRRNHLLPPRFPLLLLLLTLLSRSPNLHQPLLLLLLLPHNTTPPLPLLPLLLFLPFRWLLLLSTLPAFLLLPLPLPLPLLLQWQPSSKPGDLYCCITEAQWIPYTASSRKGILHLLLSLICGLKSPVFFFLSASFMPHNIFLWVAVPFFISLPLFLLRCDSGLLQFFLFYQAYFFLSVRCTRKSAFPACFWSCNQQTRYYHHIRIILLVFAAERENHLILLCCVFLSSTFVVCRPRSVEKRKCRFDWGVGVGARQRTLSHHLLHSFLQTPIWFCRCFFFVFFGLSFFRFPFIFVHFQFHLSIYSFIFHSILFSSSSSAS